VSYALAPVLTALAIFFRVQLVNTDGHILLIMLLPVLIVSYRGGFGPGIFCTALSSAAAAHFLLAPVYTILIENPLNHVDWLILIGSGVLVSVLCESALRARRRAEGANLRLLDRMLMLNQTSDGVFIWEWNGPITFWNSAAGQLYGFPEKHAVGRVSQELLNTTAANGMASVLSDLEAKGLWEGELCQRTRDGRQLTVKSRMLLVREPGRSFVIETNHDITDRQEADLELARIQQRFATAFRLSPLGKLVVRLADDRIIEVNDSYTQLIGASRSESVGKTLTEHSPLDKEVLSVVRRSLEADQAVNGIDIQFHRKTGEVGTGVLYAQVLQGAPDRHALVVLHDVTTRQQAEDKLRLANYDLQQFAYAAAHDLQEPTRNIATALGLFDRMYRSMVPEDGMLLIQESIDASKRMNQMIRDLLAFSHADTDTSLLEARVDANETLRHVIHHSKRLIEEIGAEIISTTLPVIAVHPTHFLQLLQNLVGNALKYRAEGVPPRIQIDAQLDGSTWTFSVADNGIGFDSAFAEQIFGVFKRLHNSKEFSGNGIGLAICERIVRLYRGRVWAESVPGKGSTFFFTLPVADVVAQADLSAIETAV
jgi:PAS domain S-box-containing protein